MANDHAGAAPLLAALRRMAALAHTDEGDVDSALVEALGDVVPVGEVRVVALSEGRSAQLPHIGSYDDEGPKLADLHNRFLAEHGLDFNGRHHEIYLSDPRRTAPAKLKTILRQPVKPAYTA
jgi:hypothetical protein